MKENKLTIYIDKPMEDVFMYSLESDNVPKWINTIEKEISLERPVKLIEDIDGDNDLMYEFYLLLATIDFTDAHLHFFRQHDAQLCSSEGDTAL